jgi:HK97 family phage portal protein
MLGRALRKGFTVIADDRAHLLTLGGMGYTTAAGVRVGPGNGMTATAVWSAVTLRAQTVAAFPIDFVDSTDVNRKPVYPGAARALWGQPNPYQTPIAFIESIGVSLDLWGGAFIIPRYNNAGEAFELWPVDPERVIEIQRLDLPNGQVGQKFTISDYGEPVNLPGRPPQLIHIPGITMPGRIRGMSPIEHHAEMIGISLSSMEHAGRFLGDGVHMTGIIETDAQMEEDQAHTLWQNFQLMHSGAKKAGRVGVLTAGAKFTSLTIPPAELQFLEQMEYGNRQIASIYRVPPHMVGDMEKTTSWGAGVAEMTEGFVKFTIIPIVIKLEQAFTAALLAGTNIVMKFGMKGLLRGSIEQRKDFYTAMYGLGVLCADDILALEDMPPLPDGLGQKRFVSVNYVPMDAPPADQQAAKDRALLAALSQLGAKSEGGA